MNSPRNGAPLLGLLRPADTSGLSESGRAYLLDLTFARHRIAISIAAVVSMPLLWFAWQEQNATPLLLWIGFFLVFGLVLRRVWRRYAADIQTMEAAALVRKWQPRIEHIALLHGAGLTMVVVLTGPQASYEFKLLVYISIAAITAANATYQNASLSIFLRFFLTGWVACTGLSVWVFPLHWQYMLPLGIFFSASIYRDAMAANRFFVDQVQLETRSQQLITQLQEARANAEAALQEKTLFLSTASHDLRQPMHAMSMLVEAIAQRSRDPAVAPLLTDLKSAWVR